MSAYLQYGATIYAARELSTMKPKLAVLVSAMLLCLVMGCEKKAAMLSAPMQSSYAKVALAAPLQRYIAESHKIDVIAPASQLQESWESLVAYCGTIQCEVISSSITLKTSDSQPTGDVSMRVAPEDLNKLLTEIAKLGKIGQHTTQREDKTADVVDTDAKIKNLTTFRDNLRVMMARPSATVKDLIEIQQQLTETQSQLDSETAMRKILANETEKIAVEVAFEAPNPDGGTGGWAEISGAFREFGSDLADSTAALISVIASIIPWLILIVPGAWIVVRIWRRVRRGRATSN